MKQTSRIDSGVRQVSVPDGANFPKDDSANNFMENCRQIIDEVKPLPIAIVQPHKPPVAGMWPVENSQLLSECNCMAGTVELKPSSCFVLSHLYRCSFWEAAGIANG